MKQRKNRKAMSPLTKNIVANMQYTFDRDLEKPFFEFYVKLDAIVLTLPGLVAASDGKEKAYKHLSQAKLNLDRARDYVGPEPEQQKAAMGFVRESLQHLVRLSALFKKWGTRGPADTPEDEKRLTSWAFALSLRARNMAKYVVARMPKQKQF